MMEAEVMVNWLGTGAGVLGVIIAVYLQTINPRRCHHGHVSVIFVAGSALTMLFAGPWVDDGTLVLGLKLAAIGIFVTLELVTGYAVWKDGETAPIEETLATWASCLGGNHG